jgi:putative membrane fusion protein
MLEQLNSLDRRISSATSEKDKYVSIYTGDIDKLDTQIAENTADLAKMIMDGGQIQYKTVKRNLDDLLTQRSDVVQGGSYSDGYITSLQSDRTELKEQLSGKMVEVRAPVAGIISFAVDGLESQLTNDSAVNLTAQSLQAMKGSVINESDGMVTKDQPLYKIIQDIYYELAVITDNNTVTENLKPDKTVTIKSNNRSLSVSATVVSNKVSGDKRVILVQASESMEKCSADRILSVDLLTDYYEGMMLPVRSLFDWDSAGETARIAILEDNYVVFVSVKVDYKNQEYAIVENIQGFDNDPEKPAALEVNDIYFVDPSKVTEEEVISN